MEEIASLYYYDHEKIHELKDRFLCSSSLELELELESVRKEMRKNKEKIMQFIHALNLAYKQRDEAISQYHNLLLHKINDPQIHPEPDIIDIFVKGKDLPQKGMLLKAVLDAGPLLQTVLVAGTLPQWRNPPPVQTCPVPLVVERSSCASSCQMLSVNFGDDGFSDVGSCLVGGGELVAAAAAATGDNNVNGCPQMGKRQRIW